MIKKTILSLIVVSTIFSAVAQKQTISVLEEVLFYDGYNTIEKLADEMTPVPDGVVRHKTSLYATKLSAEQLSLFGDEIDMEVIIKAACDNYDRTGHIHLALVPKGAETYNPDEVDKYELGRFITPFMNKNKQPDTVLYTFNLDYLKHVFKDKYLLDTYDFWMELDVFGVPYAANTEVAGCAGRNDVFYGTLKFITSSPITEQEGNVLIPLFHKFSLNNYNESATEKLYETIKSVKFSIENDLSNVKLVLITSNHGANAGGEEYNRRWHYIYFDNKLVLRYKPGQNSCEEFRKYNTQSNGIYGSNPKTDEQWQSFSNWCPGNVIDTRIIELGTLSSGSHKFTINVPEAIFMDGQGNFPLSLYLLSTMEKTDENYLEISENKVILHNDGDSKYVQVKSNTDWTVNSDQSWLTITPASQNGYVTLSFSAEKTNETRYATVTVSNKDTTVQIDVAQDELYLNIDKTLINIPAEGSTEIIEIESNVSFNTSYNNGKWFTLSYGATQKQLLLVAQKNENEKSRIGSISFTADGFETKTIKVLQEAESLSFVNQSVVDQIVVYPNPANDIININPDLNIKTVVIYTSMAQKIIEKTIGYNYSIDVAGIPPGVYLVTCIDHNMKKYTKRILKK